jgi:CheY-like chemotaxis protein/LmbE family N-acetylglucosaminyl deacetylase
VGGAHLYPAIVHRSQPASGPDGHPRSVSALAPSQVSTQGPIRILLVEDTLDHALLVQILLRKAGNFVTTHCQDGDRAMEVLETQAFDLVITDLNLPGSDGLSLTRHVKATFPHLPVVVTTGYTDPEYAHHAFQAGADEVILKPVDRDDLLRTVRNSLGLGRGQSDGVEVLAVGARPGDVEAGTAGTLIAHRERGESVAIALLERPDEATEEMARAAASVLGAQLLLPDVGMSSGDPSGLQRFLRMAVTELNPRATYIPAAEEDANDRRDAHHLAVAALTGVPNIVTYATATIGLEFRPNRFVHVGKLMSRKLEILSMYSASGRRDLAPPFAEATARYWGRLAEFTDVEPLEVLRSGRDVPVEDS